jgi:hypothetical protein
VTTCHVVVSYKRFGGRQCVLDFLHRLTPRTRGSRLFRTKRFGGNYRVLDLHHRRLTLGAEATGSSEALATRHYATRFHIPDLQNRFKFQNSVTSIGLLTMRWRSWLRHCATSQKVAGSISDGDIGIFHLRNPSDHTIALGFTQPLTEMSTRIISWGVKAAGA